MTTTSTAGQVGRGATPTLGRSVRHQGVPVEHASADGEAKDMRVLPLRMERGAFEAMVEAWKRLGLKNRTDLFRCALRAYFQGAGESEVAARM